MAVLTPEQCLGRLRVLYRDAFKIDTFDNNSVIAWAEHPELWAEQQIRHRGWSYWAVEAIVRQCRAYRKRAAIAALTAIPPIPGNDPFDPLMPQQEPQA